MPCPCFMPTIQQFHLSSCAALHRSTLILHSSLFWNSVAVSTLAPRVRDTQCSWSCLQVACTSICMQYAVWRPTALCCLIAQPMQQHEWWTELLVLWVYDALRFTRNGRENSLNGWQQTLPCDDTPVDSHRMLLPLVVELQSSLSEVLTRLSLWRRLQNQTRTTSLSRCNWLATAAISCDDGLECRWNSTSRRSLALRPMVVRRLRRRSMLPAKTSRTVKLTLGDAVDASDFSGIRCYGYTLYLPLAYVQLYAHRQRFWGKRFELLIIYVY